MITSPSAAAAAVSPPSTARLCTVQKCALIEAKELGGTCVNVGCVPKKVMWHAAQIREAIHMYGPDYGFDTTINKFNWETLIASRTAYIDRIHTSYENVLGKK